MLAPLVALSLGLGVAGTFLTKDLVVSNVDISPDGFLKTSTLVNNAYPAPLLAVNKVFPLIQV